MELLEEKWPFEKFPRGPSFNLKHFASIRERWKRTSGDLWYYQGTQGIKLWTQNFLFQPTGFTTTTRRRSWYVIGTFSNPEKWYKIDVRTKEKSWSVYRRYNNFESLMESVISPGISPKIIKLDKFMSTLKMRSEMSALERVRIPKKNFFRNVRKVGLLVSECEGEPGGEDPGAK